MVEVGWGIYYNTWCDDEDLSEVRVYAEPREAIREALRRAARSHNDHQDDLNSTH